MTNNSAYRYTWFFLFISLCLIVCVACKNRGDKILNEGTLTFSSQEIVFDTLFSQTRSVSRKFRVFNKNKHALSIKNIWLDDQSNNDIYNIRVNGIPFKEFKDVTISGGDSMLVLVEVTIPTANAEDPYVIENKLIFDIGHASPAVKLRIWVQDAIFYKGKQVLCDVIWSKGKPIVITDSVEISANCELKIEAGTRIYFSSNAKLIVRGAINIEGSADEPVFLSNDNDISMIVDEFPGYWNGIEIYASNQVSTIKWTKIKNTTNGIQLIGTSPADSIPELILEHTIVGNCSERGITVNSADIRLVNCLVYNCIDHNISIIRGARASIHQSTIAVVNYSFSRRGVLLHTDNNNQQRVWVNNSILWSDKNTLEEINVGTSSLYVFNSLLKTENTNVKGVNNIYNQDPVFLAGSQEVFRIASISPAIEKGNELYLVELDLKGRTRVGIPDIGAYKFVPLE